MAYDKPIIIQVQDPDTEAWTDKYRLHACVNKSNGNTVWPPEQTNTTPI